MLFDTLEMIIEGRNGAVWFILSGPFSKEQIPQMREKLSVLLEDGNRNFVVNLEEVTSIDDSVVQLYLKFFNKVKGKGGELTLIFRNEIIAKAFAPYQNIIPVFPDETFLLSGGFMAGIKRRSKLLLRKTGIRISRPVALFTLIVLFGWFISLIYIIHIQSRHLKEQQTKVHDLSQWQQRSIIEIRSMKERLRPLEQLGIIKDTLVDSK